jgi:hypothetical protein
MTLKEIKEFLLGITLNVYHYEAWQQPDTYIVWAEDGESDAIHGDNKKLKQILDVTIDVYTKDEYPEIIEQLQQGFNDKGIPFELLSIQYEKDTKYVHYEYLIQAVV